MRKPLLIIGLLVAVVYACNQQSKIINPLLSPGKLPSQVFTIDLTKDTILHTQHGALIRIPRGALSASSNTVQLEVKEAYTMQDMLKAGLTTMSNGKPLSSGGMIYINAVGENKVTITQKISIATPTPFLDSSMQVYKGEVQADSTINWVDPKPMSENPQLEALVYGNLFFKMNCASCHAIDKDLTGPALAGSMERLLPIHHGNKKGIYDFVRNPAKVMANEKYYQALKRKYIAMMTPFPALTDTALDYIFAYIENETNKKFGIPGNAIASTCEDSCLRYYQEISKWKLQKVELEQGSNMVQDIRNYPIDTTIHFKDSVDAQETNEPVDPTTWDDVQRVQPGFNNSFYYQFTIESFGWRNIDCQLITDNTKQSELKVRVPEQYTDRLSIYLIIPSGKLMIPGGLLKNKKDEYGFDMADGRILLPQQEKAYIIAMGEEEDQVIFAKTEFIIKEKQAFDLTLRKISQETFQQEMNGLPLNDIDFKVKEINSTRRISNAVKKIEEAEKLKPKGCNCNLSVMIPNK